MLFGRKSYGKDILFTVEKIIETKSGNAFCILKGLTVRVEADADIDDLEIIQEAVVKSSMRSFDDKLNRKIKQLQDYREENSQKGFLREEQ